MRNSALLAVGLNAGVGLLSLVWAAFQAPLPAAEPPPRRATARPTRFWLHTAFFLSGAACFGVEIVQSRLLSYLVGNRIFAAALILSVFLGAMALGSLAYHALLRSRTGAAAVFAWSQVGIGLCGLAFLAGLPQLQAWAQAHEAAQASQGVWVLVRFKAALAAAALSPPAFLMGLAFPAMLDQLSAGRPAPQAVGRAIAWNTAGCIAGSLFTGFWLIPRVDSWNAGLIMALLALLLGHRFLAPDWGRAPAWRRGLSLIACLVLLASGALAALERRHYPLPRPGLKLVSAQEDSTALFSLWRGRLGHYIFGDSTPLSFPVGPRSRAEQVQRFQGLLPLLLHPQAQRAVVVGLGFGSTTGAMAATGALQQLDTVELFPSLIQAMGRLPQVNEKFLKQPRSFVHVGDGRHFLRDKAGAYDIVATNLTDADMPGSASCYTLEYMQLARRSLAPGGLFLIHTYGPQREVLLKTVAAAFPWAEAYQAYKNSLFILAAEKAPRWDPKGINARLAKSPKLRLQAHKAGIRKAQDLRAMRSLTDRRLRALAARDPATPLNTDDLPVMEYHMGRPDQLFKADL